MVKTQATIAQVTQKFGPTLTDPGNSGDLLWVIRMSLQLWAYRIGAIPGLKQLRQPDNAKTLLLPSVEAVLKAAPVLWVNARAVLEGLDLDKARTNQQRLVFVREVIQETQDFLEQAQALESNLEQDLDDTVRTVYNRGLSLADANKGIRRLIDALGALVSGDAVQGVETRKKIDKAIEEALKKLEEEAAGKPPGPTPPPTGPATPPGNPATPPTPPAHPGHTLHTKKK